MRILLALALAASASTALAQSSPPIAGASLETPGPAATLADLVERAWRLGRQSGIDAARSAEIDARALANRSPFAGAPTVGVDLRRDLPRWAGLPGTDTVAERGRNEIEPGVSAPLWLPGQRRAQGRVLDQERQVLDAASRLARLQVAGDVREAVWAQALAQAEWRVQQAREQAARHLEADVERRVRAGDLAPADRLMARTEVLAATVSVREAQARVEASAARLRQLTGLDAAADVREEVAPDGATDPHPALAAAREAVAASRARLDYARATRRDNPTVSAVARFDRDAYGTGYRNTLRVGIAVPLDTEARNAPRLAAASTELTEAEITLLRREREQAAEVERARIALAAARATLDVNAERAAIARDTQIALERAFRAGERGLPDVLRVRAQVLDAELAREVARQQLGLATARLNQAQGVQP